MSRKGASTTMDVCGKIMECLVAITKEWNHVQFRALHLRKKVAFKCLIRLFILYIYCIYSLEKKVVPIVRINLARKNNDKLMAILKIAINQFLFSGFISGNNPFIAILPYISHTHTPNTIKQPIYIIYNYPQSFPSKWERKFSYLVMYHHKKHVLNVLF